MISLIIHVDYVVIRGVYHDHHTVFFVVQVYYDVSVAEIKWSYSTLNNIKNAMKEFDCETVHHLFETQILHYTLDFFCLYKKKNILLRY